MALSFNQYSTNMKRPYEAVKESFFENLDKLKENQRYNFSNSDKYIVKTFPVYGLLVVVPEVLQG